MLENLRVRARSSDATNPARRWTSLSWVAIVVGSAYILSARLSLSLLTPEGVAVFWPAAGVAAGALIALGPQARWAVVAGTMVATIVANLLGDRNLLSSIVFAICNAGEALLTAGLIERYFGSPFSLDRLRHVLGLVGAAIVAAAVTGIGGALGIALFHAPTASIFDTWQNWFASDALGIVTIAPLVIGLASAAREPPTQNESIEGLIALASLIVMSVIVIALPPVPWTTVVPLHCCFRSCCGLRHAAGRSSLRSQPSSSPSQSSGRRRSESVASAILASRWQTASLPLVPASWLSPSVHTFSPRCSPSGGSMKPRSRRARPACRRR
jgi:integral membrane sensor domain MASE1